jgi:hypothetical protein
VTGSSNGSFTQKKNITLCTNINYDHK